MLGIHLARYPLDVPQILHRRNGRLIGDLWHNSDRGRALFGVFVQTLGANRPQRDGRRKMSRLIAVLVVSWSRAKIVLMVALR